MTTFDMEQREKDFSRFKEVYENGEVSFDPDFYEFTYTYGNDEVKISFDIIDVTTMEHLAYSSKIAITFGYMKPELNGELVLPCEGHSDYMRKIYHKCVSRIKFLYKLNPDTFNEDIEV